MNISISNLDGMICFSCGGVCKKKRSTLNGMQVRMFYLKTTACCKSYIFLTFVYNAHPMHIDRSLAVSHFIWDTKYSDIQQNESIKSVLPGPILYESIPSAFFS